MDKFIQVLLRILTVLSAIILIVIIAAKWTGNYLKVDYLPFWGVIIISLNIILWIFWVSKNTSLLKKYILRSLVLGLLTTFLVQMLLKILFPLLPYDNFSLQIGEFKTYKTRTMGAFNWGSPITFYFHEEEPYSDDISDLMSNNNSINTITKFSLTYFFIDIIFWSIIWFVVLYIVRLIRIFK